MVSCGRGSIVSCYIGFRPPSNHACVLGVNCVLFLSFRLCGTVPNRVRVAVRLRPRNAEELQADVDSADCVELQPEVCFEDQDSNLGLSEAKLQIFVGVTMMQEMLAFDFL